MKTVARKFRDIQQLFQKEMKVSCCSLENIASARSRKYFVDRGCFPHEQMGHHLSITDKGCMHKADLSE